MKSNHFHLIYGFFCTLSSKCRLSWKIVIFLLFFVHFHENICGFFVHFHENVDLIKGSNKRQNYTTTTTKYGERKSIEIRKWNNDKVCSVGIFYYLIIFRYQGKYRNNKYISCLSIVSLNWLVIKLSNKTIRFLIG